MQIPFSGAKSNSLVYGILVTIILFGGIWLRIYKFPEIPPGLNIDEAASAYEAYSLLETGKDKWGHKLPVYFPGWGSGQNVLLSYLSIPAIKFFGLTIFSARITSLVLGILTLPLFFITLRPLGRFPALLGLLLLSVVPWHFMLSRWALESNLVPFFMLLGSYLLSRALLTGRKFWIVPSLLPFALALYAYGTASIVLPLLFLFIFLLHFNTVRLHGATWLWALTLFLLMAFPFLIFFIEHHLLKANLAFADSFFFGTPLLPSNRLDQSYSYNWKDIILLNFKFLKDNFNDNSNYNMLPGFKLLLPSVVTLTLIGLIGIPVQILTKRNSDAAQTVMLVFFCWAVASLSLFFAFQLNVNRFNLFFLPALALTVWVVYNLLILIPKVELRTGLKVMICLAIIIHSCSAVRYYFTEYPKTDIQEGFNAGLKEAFEATKKLPVTQIRVTNALQLSLSYMYALYYLEYPPAEFQQHGNFTIENGMYKVNRFGKYIFYDEYLDQNKDYGFLARKGEFKANANHFREIVYENEFWEVGIMHVSKPIL